MKTITDFWSILDTQTLIVTILALGSTFLCQHFGLLADIPTGLIGLAVVFPIVFSINAAYRRREEAPPGTDPGEIAARGAGEVAGAVTASTLTTLAVFVPIVFVVVGVAGQIFRDQALTVTFSLLVSLFVALTFTPMAAAFGQGARSDALVGDPVRKSWYASWSGKPVCPRVAIHRFRDGCDDWVSKWRPFVAIPGCRLRRT